MRKIRFSANALSSICERGTYDSSVRVRIFKIIFICGVLPERRKFLSIVELIIEYFPTSKKPKIVIRLQFDYYQRFGT